jgi:hypothetical protein
MNPIRIIADSIKQGVLKIKIQVQGVSQMLQQYFYQRLYVRATRV